jgi:hypothetical protein
MRRRFFLSRGERNAESAGGTSEEAEVRKRRKRAERKKNWGGNYKWNKEQIVRKRRG